MRPAHNTRIIAYRPVFAITYARKVTRFNPLLGKEHKHAVSPGHGKFPVGIVFPAFYGDIVGMAFYDYVVRICSKHKSDHRT